MSTTAIMSAINAYAKTAAENNRKMGKALATFSNKDGVFTPTCGKAKEAELSAMGLDKNAYIDYANTIKNIYFAAVHIVNAGKDAATVEKIRAHMHADTAHFCDIIAGNGTKMNDILNFNEFVNACVSRVVDFRASADGYDAEALRISAFVRWLEAYTSFTLSGKAMLSFAERDRRRDLAKWSTRVDKLEKSLAAWTEKLDTMDTSDASDENVKAIAAAKASIEEVKSSLEQARAKKEEAEKRPTDYTEAETFHETNAQ